MIFYFVSSASHYFTRSVMFYFFSLLGLFSVESSCYALFCFHPVIWLPCPAAYSFHQFSPSHLHLLPLIGPLVFLCHFHSSSVYLSYHVFLFFAGSSSIFPHPDSLFLCLPAIPCVFLLIMFFFTIILSYFLLHLGPPSNNP